ncbi:hypothetical protein U2A4042350006 [Corynebacterium striatum]|nr:hypothetical protein U2A4042350006 [Corynebacterium striatum]
MTRIATNVLLVTFSWFNLLLSRMDARMKNICFSF